MKETAAVLALVVAIGCTPGKPNETRGHESLPTQTSAQTTTSTQATEGISGACNGQSVISPLPMQRAGGPSLVRIEQASPFAFIQKAGPAPEKACDGYPEIDQWSQKRNLDTMLVRALILSESGFDPCAAGKVCSKEAIGSNSTMGCFAADFSGNSEGYSMGYDEMHDPRATTDPTHACLGLETAPQVPGKSPDWRWLATGLMQTIEPPYTFWPGKYLASGLADGVDNPHHDVFERSGPWANRSDPKGSREIPELVSAGGCNPRFNPFNPSDSLCVGTLNLERMIRYGHAWIRDHPELGFGDAGVDSEKANVFAAYIAANMYTGMWLSKARDVRGMTEAHPMCPTSMSNGACWTAAFADSRNVTPKYCADKKDDEACKGKKPRWEPPYHCYGETDFIRFVRECWDPLNYRPDTGANVMSLYYWLKKGCK